MTKYQSRCREMFVRVCRCGEQNPDWFPAGSLGGEAMAVITREIAVIHTLGVSDVMAVDGRRWRARERAATTRALLLITRAARQITRLDGTGECRFVMPTPRTDRRLLETARGFLRDLDPLQDRFISLGFPPTFLVELRERTDRFACAVDRRRAAQRESVAVRAGCRQAFTRACDAVLTLDIYVACAHGDNPISLETWKGTRRVDRRRVRHTRRKMAA